MTCVSMTPMKFPYGVSDFGKIILEHYYDVNRAGQFDALFGDLAIGQNPTPLHNRYCILHWDFSLVKTQGEVREIEQAVHTHLNDCLQDFVATYQAILTWPVHIDKENALSSWRSVLTAVSKTGYSMYLFIDEYDNFSNEKRNITRNCYTARDCSKPCSKR